MDKIKVQYLDLPIIRSCNLACVGCLTHSDHKKIKGTVQLDESHEWLEFWSQRLDPATVTLFGGEPLLHPGLVGWAKAVKDYWPASTLNMNTNGYYISNIFDSIEDLFNPNMELSMVISIQTGTEPYLSKVKNDIETLKQKVLDYYTTLPDVQSVRWHLWLDETDTNQKKWFNLEVNGYASAIGFAVCEQYKLPWCIHYTGFGDQMRPVYDYNDSWKDENHQYCQAKKFTTLYRGNLYKCPPVGVLEHSLTTFDIDKLPEWAPYLDQYKTVGINSTDEEIAAWITNQACPENVCNMCGFAGPKSRILTADDRSHVLKNHWNYTL
jgi:organic radical activating enzyme